MDTKRNTPLRAVIWLYTSGTIREATLADQERLCTRADPRLLVVDVLRAEGKRRPYRALNAHCRAQDFDVLVMRDWHRLAADRRRFDYWVDRVVTAGARLYGVESNWWIGGAAVPRPRIVRVAGEALPVTLRSVAWEAQVSETLVGDRGMAADPTQ